MGTPYSTLSEESMKRMSVLFFGFATVIGNLICSAQNVPIPFNQIERSYQISARTSDQGDEGAYNLASVSSFSSSRFPILAGMEPSFSGIERIPTPMVRHTFTRSYLVLNGLHLATTILDIEMTQHCIADHHCREGNPLMPSSHVGQLTVGFALVGYGSFISYRLKRHSESRLWWIPPASGIVAHTIGTTSGIAHW
jgi:hypothetical protein